MSSNEKPISEKFFSLINPAPSFRDPEDDVHEDTVAKLVDKSDSFSEDEQQASGIRKPRPLIQADDDKRYTGQKISRKKLMKQIFCEGNGFKQITAAELDSTSISSNEEEKDEISEEEKEHNYDSDIQSPSISSNEEKDEISEEEKEHAYDSEEMEESKNEEEISSIQHISRRLESDIEKGNAVKNQLKLWDNLLECRIQFQKCLLAANRLPQHSTFPQFEVIGGSKFKKEVTQTKHSITNLLEKLIMFRIYMLKSYSETRNLGEKAEEKKTLQPDEEIPSDSEHEFVSNSVVNINDENEPSKAKRRKLEDYSQLLSSQHKEYILYRNETIQKWNDKTRLYVGKLSNRNFSSFEQSTVKQIEQILSNHHRLIQRTQLKRSAYSILGLNHSSEQKVSFNSALDAVDGNENKTSIEETKDVNTEIFDDTDFYHQLLREIIERKASDITDPVQLGRQWIELQKLRSKMKRKIDTRATKGRKIRYVVHPKLVNFMAPVPHCTWKDEAKTELYNSLFGSNNL